MRERIKVDGEHRKRIEDGESEGGGGRDREKLEESESVCECNSLPLSNPREFTDCGKEETARTKEGGGSGCDHSSERRKRERETKERETAGKRKVASIPGSPSRACRASTSGKCSL